MCKYCDFQKSIDGGKIGERIGGRAYPCYLAELDEVDFLDGQHWIVESESFHSRDNHKYHRLFSVNFCPVCGKHLNSSYC